MSRVGWDRAVNRIAFPLTGVRPRSRRQSVNHPDPLSGQEQQPLALARQSGRSTPPSAKETSSFDQRAAEWASCGHYQRCDPLANATISGAEALHLDVALMHLLKLLKSPGAARLLQHVEEIRAHEKVTSESAVPLRPRTLIAHAPGSENHSSPIIGVKPPHGRTVFRRAQACPVSQRQRR